MPTAPDYAAQVRQILAITEPELDTSIGTVTRKMIDAFAQVQAMASADAAVQNYVFQIDAKSGSDLDDFVLTFSMVRLMPKRSVGTVTLSRPSAAQVDVPIAPGTQIATATSPAVVFATVAPAVLTAGSTSVDVAVQAVVTGAASNVPAGSLTMLASEVQGVTSITNDAPTTGGADAETDVQLRDRFKRTVFRNMAGTDDMYLGVALDQNDSAVDNPVSQALVLGASRRWREQVQIQADGTATSTIPASNVKYVYPGTQFFGPDIDNGAIMTPGVHYTFDATVTPPRIVGLGTALVPGDLYDLDFEYSSAASRNDPANGITNRIDVWVTGSNPVEATETVYMRRARAFTAAAGNQLTTANFVREDTNNVHPTAGNYFVQLAYGPIVAFPDALTIGGATYHKGTDYWVVHDDTAFGYGPTSLYGIEWNSANAPVEGAQISLSGSGVSGTTQIENGYAYNSVPRDVENRIRQWRITTQDARAHAAKTVQLRVNLVVQFDPLAPQSQTISNINTALTAFFSQRGFDAILQVSDILQVVHNVIGVDNVRLMTSFEQGANRTAAQGYAVQQVASDGTVIKTFATPDPATAGQSSRANDIVLGDNEVPVLHDVAISVRAQNTFGTT